MNNVISDKYSNDEVFKILNGYTILNKDRKYSKLLNKIASCKKCFEISPAHQCLPFNSLVRGLPLQNFLSLKDMNNYRIRIKRDDTFLRNLLNSGESYEIICKKIKSEKFSIGVFPWLDRCMLYRENIDTKLMVLGIDYKHFPIVCRENNNQNFPLDSYRKSNNIWNVTWRFFWKNVLNESYDDKKVNNFISLYGVYMTNSMLCFGGSDNPGRHDYSFIENCRVYIEDQIRIVKPKILLSFGNIGCRNASAILLKENPKNKILKELSISNSPISILRKIVNDKANFNYGIPVEYNNSSLYFWSVYQPARAKNRFFGDYEVVRRLLSTC